MKKSLIFFITSIVYLSFLLSCTSASEDDLIESIDETEDITYTENVKSIIDNNCIFCHSNPPVNGAPVHLTTYDNVKNAVENSNLINRISAQPGDAGFMPSGGSRLPQSQIDLIIQWQADGLLE